MLLSSDELTELHAIAITTALADKRSSLLGGIGAEITNQIPMPAVGATVTLAAQLLDDLNALNGVWEGTGDPPLAIWLANAGVLLSGQPQAQRVAELRKTVRDRAEQLREQRSGDGRGGTQRGQQRGWRGWLDAHARHWKISITLSIALVGASVLFLIMASPGPGPGPSTGLGGSTWTVRPIGTDTTSTGTTSTGTTSTGTTSTGTTSAVPPIPPDRDCNHVQARFQGALGSMPSSVPGNRVSFTVHVQDASYTVSPPASELGSVGADRLRQVTLPSTTRCKRSFTVGWER